MNQQPIKRRNPFETPKVEERVEKVIEPVVEEEIVEEIEQEPVYIAPKPVQVQHPRQQPVQKTVRQSPPAICRKDTKNESAHDIIQFHPG